MYIYTEVTQKRPNCVTNIFEIYFFVTFQLVTFYSEVCELLAKKKRRRQPKSPILISVKGSDTID